MEVGPAAKAQRSWVRAVVQVQEVAGEMAAGTPVLIKGVAAEALGAKAAMGAPLPVWPGQQQQPIQVVVAVAVGETQQAATAAPA